MRPMLASSMMILALTLAVSRPVPAEAKEPCCGITAIDAKTQTVTARETKTGRTFQFKVADAALLRSLKVGQAVAANFTTIKVSVHLDREEPCCNIANLRGPGEGR